MAQLKYKNYAILLVWACIYACDQVHGNMKIEEQIITVGLVSLAPRWPMYHVLLSMVIMFFVMI